MNRIKRGGFALAVALVTTLLFGGSFAQVATASPTASFVLADTGPAAPAGGIMAHPFTPPKKAAKVAGFTGSGYYYAEAMQTFSGTDIVKGVSATIEINEPYVEKIGTCSQATGACDHSLAELLLQGPNGDAVEFGYAAEPNVTAFGDTKPRLFASRWKYDSSLGYAVWGGCYGEGCGWIDKTPMDSTDDLGIDLTSVAQATWPNNAKSFKVAYESPTNCGPSVNTGNWQFYYGTSSSLVNIGCYPPTQVPSFNAVDARAFWEVNYTAKAGGATGGTKPCTDMGRLGRFGSQYNGSPIDTNDPAYFGSISYYGSSLPAYNLSLFSTDSTMYDIYSIGAAGNRTVVGGGPGASPPSGTTPGGVNCT